MGVGGGGGDTIAQGKDITRLKSFMNWKKKKSRTQTDK